MDSSISPAMKEFTKRIRNKLDHKTTQKVATMSTTPAPTKKAPNSKKKGRSNAPIVLSGSDSDAEAEAGVASDDSEKKAVAKLADPPAGIIFVRRDQNIREDPKSDQEYSV